MGHTRTGDRQQAELQQVAVTTYNWDIFIILGLQDVAPAEEEGEVGQTELQPQVYFTKTEMEGKTCDFQDVLNREPRQEEHIGEEKEEGQPKLQSRVR